jgi:hypothetical protein
LGLSSKKGNENFIKIHWHFDFAKRPSVLEGFHDKKERIIKLFSRLISDSVTSVYGPCYPTTFKLGILANRLYQLKYKAAESVF